MASTRELSKIKLSVPMHDALETFRQNNTVTLPACWIKTGTAVALITRGLISAERYGQYQLLPDGARVIGIDYVAHIERAHERAIAEDADRVVCIAPGCGEAFLSGPRYRHDRGYTATQRMQIHAANAHVPISVIGWLKGEPLTPEQWNIARDHILGGIEVNTRVKRVGEQGEGTPTGVVLATARNGAGVDWVHVSFSGLSPLWMHRDGVVPVQRLPLDEAWRAAMYDRGKAGRTGDVMTKVPTQNEVNSWVWNAAHEEYFNRAGYSVAALEQLMTEMPKNEDGIRVWVGSHTLGGVRTATVTITGDDLAFIRLIDGLNLSLVPGHTRRPGTKEYVAVSRLYTALATAVPLVRLDTDVIETKESHG